VSAIYLQRDIDNITRECVRAHNAHVVAIGNGKDRDKKRAKIEKIANRFFAIMNSDNPPKTRSEAIMMIAPFWWTIAFWIGRALAEQIVNWLWRQTQGD
jgi:hypothetical protein